MDKMSNCTNDNKMCMPANNVKMNNEKKTEIVLRGTSPQLKSVPINSVKIGDSVINFPQLKKQQHTHTLDMHLESSLAMDFCVLHFWGNCYLKIRKTTHHKPFITKVAAKKLLISIVISRLDHCNAFYYNMTNDKIHELHLIQNHAPRLVK